MTLKNIIPIIILTLALVFYPISAVQKLSKFTHPNYETTGLVKYHGTYVSCSDPVLMKIILAAFKRVEDSGFILPKAIVVQRAEFSYITKSPMIEDPKDALIMGDTDVISNIVWINDYTYKYNVDSEFHTIFHELGHVNHLSKVLETKKPKFVYDKITGKIKSEDKDFTKLKLEITATLGDYAATNELEFVAEYFAAMLEGKDLRKTLLTFMTS